MGAATIRIVFSYAHWPHCQQSCHCQLICSCSLAPQNPLMDHTWLCIVPLPGGLKSTAIQTLHGPAFGPRSGYFWIVVPCPSSSTPWSLTCASLACPLACRKVNSYPFLNEPASLCFFRFVPHSVRSPSTLCLHGTSFFGSFLPIPFLAFFRRSPGLHNVSRCLCEGGIVTETTLSKGWMLGRRLLYRSFNKGLAFIWRLPVRLAWHAHCFWSIQLAYLVFI